MQSSTRQPKLNLPKSVQNNYYFIRSLSHELAHQLIGLEAIEIFSQHKDELVIGLANAQHEFWIRATFTPELSTLSFPDTFARAKRNSIDLFTELIGKKVLAIQQFQNERAFAIEFEENLTLLFKLFGTRSNCILFQDNEAVFLFENRHQQDWDIELAALDRSLDQEKEDFLAQGLKKTFPTFGKEIGTYLDKQRTTTQEEEWIVIQALLNYLEGDALKFYIFLEKSDVKLSLFNPEDYLESYTLLHQATSALEALNLFYTEFSRRYYLQKEKTAALKTIEKRHRQTQNYIEKTQQKLEMIEHAMRYEEFGHLIMANLHAIEPRLKEVELLDFYRDNQPIKIPLKDNLSAQKNAELFYRKAKNQKVEIDNLYQNLERKENQLAEFDKQLQEVEAFTSLKELRKYLKEHKITLDTSQNTSIDELPFKTFEFEDFQILVGKNSKNNDLLTQKYAYKEDLWLHARGVAGSHVVIKYRAGKPFPKSVIEKAASLAAYYSKSKTDSLCPVIVTPKKFVRKPKGAALGAVVVEREEVVMVEPKAFEG